MGSGFFPVDTRRHGGGQFQYAKDALASLKRFRDEMLELAHENNQTDNAVTDGIYLGELGVAIGLIEGLFVQTPAESEREE